MSSVHGFDSTGNVDDFFGGEVRGAETGESAAAMADPARTGWASPRAPNGRVLPFDLSRLAEDDLLRPGKKAALYPLGAGPQDFHPDREPLILVHGIQGDPKVLQGVVERLKASDRYQLYVLCYDDDGRRTSLNGTDMAEELRTLQARALGEGRDVSVVAHSMGGIVTRRALNELAVGPGGGLEKLGRVRFTAVDTPWHGYGGPSDRGVEGFMMNVVRPFMPDGLEDMRAASAMFQGDPSSRNPAAKAGLLRVELPDNVETDYAFASEGKEIADYTEDFLKPLAPMLVKLYKDEGSVRGEPRLENFWRALLSSSQYHPFAEEMRDLADAGTLDAAKVEAALLRHFPRYPGDHDGVLKEQPGRPSFLDCLEARLLGPE